MCTVVSSRAHHSTPTAASSDWCSVGRSAAGRGGSADAKRHTLVLDMDETLLHSSFDPTPADFIVPITNADGRATSVYVRKRPFVEYFLRKACDMFNVIIWTASVRSYAGPIIDALVQAAGGNTASIQRMYRTACTSVAGNYIKDLSSLDVPLENVCIVDNSPVVSVLQPRNYIPISSWFRDAADAELLDKLSLLERLRHSTSVFDVLNPQ